MNANYVDILATEGTRQSKRNNAYGLVFFSPRGVWLVADNEGCRFVHPGRHMLENSLGNSANATDTRQMETCGITRFSDLGGRFWPKLVDSDSPPDKEIDAASDNKESCLCLRSFARQDL